MANIKVLFWFDVEDFVTPETDEALLGLLNLCEERKIKGVFKFVGEKMRVIKERGRTDILEKLKNHEVGFHTNMHSQHPTISEYLEESGFRDGCLEFEKREEAGLEDVRDITMLPVNCYGQPGGSWAPQQFPVLKKWGIPVYLDNHNQVTLNDKPYWYGGILNFMELVGFMRMELEEDGLDKAKQKFDEVCEKLSDEPVGFVSIVYHPCEFATGRFWDDCNFSNGKNTPREEWVPAPLRPEGEMEYYLKRLGQFLDYTLSKENVEYITSAQAYELECSNRGSLEPNEVEELALLVEDKLNYAVYKNHTLSTSDLHSLFCHYLLGKELSPELIYGPENEIESDPISTVNVSDLKEAIKREYPQVYHDKQLPDFFMVRENKLNPVDLTCTLAKVIALGLNDVDEVSVIRGNLHPQVHARSEELWGGGWPIFPKDFRVPNIVAMSKLQTWTLKPAIFG